MRRKGTADERPGRGSANPRSPATQQRVREGRRDVATSRKGTELLRRLADSAALPAFVATLAPRTLLGLVEYVGINDASEIMALASPQQLTTALDLAVWKPAAPGAAESFDAAVFTQWLEAWLDIGEAFTGERLLALDEEYLGTALSSLIEVQSIHVRGFEGSYGWKLEKRFDAESDLDIADRGGFDTRSADELAHDARWRNDAMDEQIQDAVDRPRDDADDFDRDTRVWADARPAKSSPTDQAFFGEYVVGGLVSDEWDVVLAALNALWATDADMLLALLGRLAATPTMLAVGDHRAVLRDDVARERELLQTAKGFVTPLSARAFLATIASSSLDVLADATVYDPETAQHFARVQAAAEAAAQADVDAATTAAATANLEPSNNDAARSVDAQTLAELHAILIDAGIETAQNAAVAALPAPSDARQIDIAAAIATLAAGNPEAAATRLQELAYLANVIVVGIQRDGEAIDEAAAAQIVLATAGLGLDFLARHQGTSIDDALLQAPGVVRAFGVGWQLVSALPMHVVAACADALTAPAIDQRLRRNPWLREEMQAGLNELSRGVREGRFADAREALTLLSLVLDADACRRLRPVLDGVPCIASAGNDDAARWIRSLHDLQVISADGERLASASRKR